MSLLTDILELFSPGTPVSLEEYETQDTFVLTATISAASAPDSDKLYRHMTQVSSRDTVEIVFGGDVPDMSLREVSNGACVTFAREIDSAIRLNSIMSEDDSSFRIKIVITKGRSEGILSLYSLDSFVSFLDPLDVQQKLAVFRNLLQSGNVIFACHDGGDAFETKTLRAAVAIPATGTDYINRRELLDTREEVCHFRNSGDYQFIPEDFHLLSRSRNEKFNGILDCLCFVVSVSYLCDITDVSENTLSLRLNGYKVISEKVEFPAAFQNSLPEVYKLYSWAYSGGNVSDKIGIIRNLISLYAKDSILKVEIGVFAAARSNYEIYLKENIGRYLEIKNNIANKLLEMSQNCTRSIETFGSYFKQSIFAISSFFITIVVLAAIDKEKYGNVFSNDVKQVSIGLIMISFVHMVFTIEEYKKRYQRFTKEYHYLKQSYNDVLDQKDIERIFGNDISFSEDCRYLRSELVRYASCWGVILGILLVLTLSVSTS